MFGVILSGQLVRTDFQLLEENKFLIRLSNVENINHIVLFLTGTMPFPEGMGGLVYFSLPDASEAPAWHLLGFLSNDKPSVIFKVHGLKHKKTHFNADGTPFTFRTMGTVCLEAQIGIAVESLASIQQQCPSNLGNNNVEGPVALQFCKKMLENLFNFTMSYATPMQLIRNPSETYVPVSVLKTWYTNFERRLMQSPDFYRD